MGTATSEQLRIPFRGDRQIGVDFDKQRINGYLVAQEGAFRTPGRGEFDRQALRQIVKLMKAEPVGLKSRFEHPGMFTPGLGRFLGRLHDPRLETMQKAIGPDEQGRERSIEIGVVRADLHLDESAFITPFGDLATYLMKLANSDPAAISSSLALNVQREFRLDKAGRMLTDSEGLPLPPLWRPVSLEASDVVDIGDAVDGLLSAHTADGTPALLELEGTALLDRLFDGQPREDVERQLTGWLARYLGHRYPDSEAEDESPSTDGDESRPAAKRAMLARRLRLKERTFGSRQARSAT